MRARKIVVFARLVFTSASTSSNAHCFPVNRICLPCRFVVVGDFQSSGLVLARPLHRLASRDFARDPPSYITLDQGATRDRDKPFTSFQKKTENAEVAKEAQNRKAHKGEKRKKEKKVGIARIWKESKQLHLNDDERKRSRERERQRVSI